MVFTSCNFIDSEKKDKNSETISVNIKDKSKETKSKKTFSRKCSKNFKSFFSDFGRDSLFQKERIKFPLKYLISDFDYELDKDTFGIDLVKKENYEYIDFSIDEKAMDKKYGKYTVETIIVNDTLILYNHIGYDNGIKVSYKFNLIKDCWYLIEVIDESS
ncbi:hypothetical protein [Tenacibaculum amylolyticum]|uniref:hypothetical protein n=1 Tax=Tenacibaculum amylolyticum TaxID=104269 RepID=UPI0038949B0D